MKLLAVATGGALLDLAAVSPGVHVDAAVVLGGVCRVMISLVVICLELTGGKQIIPAFMPCSYQSWSETCSQAASTICALNCAVTLSCMKRTRNRRTD